MGRQEHVHLRRFCETYSAVPNGELHFDDKPDLRLHTDDGLVLGIEHTRVLHPARLDGLVPKEQEEIQKQIAARTLEYSRAGRNLPLYVDIEFNDRIRLKRTDVERVARAICDTVYANLPPYGVDTIIEQWMHAATLPAEVSYLAVFRWEKAAYPVWSAGTGGAVPVLDSSRLQKIIDDKNEQAGHYDPICDDLWLLIVIDGHSHSGAWVIPADVKSTTYKSRFSRVVLYNYFEASFQEVNVSPLA